MLGRFVVVTVLSITELVAASSSISLSVAPNPATYGSPVTLTATVSPGDSTGKVTFYDGVSVLGIANVSSGTATFTTWMLPSGARSVKAYYSGNGSYSPSTSTPWIENVHTVSGKGFVLGQPGISTGSYLAVGDFNGDGKLDLVSSGNFANIRVALGHGDGTFSAPVTYLDGSVTQGVVTGDFNGDGKLDLAVAIGSGKIVDILLGLGDGSFGAGTPYPVPGQVGFDCTANSLGAADFNRDGKIDLAVGTKCSQGILLGVGDGAFTTGQSYQSAQGTKQTLVEDLNGDGLADILSIGSFGSIALLGNGDATFTVTQDSQGIAFAVTGDFDGDGKIDLAARSPSGVLVRPGNGDGTFGAFIDSSVPGFYSVDQLVTEDFNADGKPDVAASSLLIWGGGLGLAFGVGDGTFQETFVGPPTGLGNLGLTAADFNGDGRPDLATAGFLVLLGAPDTGLDLIKTHSGNFQQGQSGATYSIMVRNIGPQPTSDVVTVIDTLPVSLTGTSIAGMGWDCTLVGLKCTRNDVLAVNASYPPITVTVTVATWAPPKVLNVATVAFGSAAFPPPDDYANDPTVILAGQLISFGPLPNRALASSPFLLKATASSGLAVTFSAAGSCSVAQATVTLTGAGSCSITASQAGDGTYPPAPDVVRSFTIFSTSSSVALSSSLNPSRLSSPITLTATVTPSNATGTVTFYDGTTVLGIKNISGGSAAITLKFLPTGNRSLHAYYSGDGNNPGSKSGTLIQTVRSLTSPGLFAANVQDSNLMGRTFDIATGDFDADGKQDIVYGSRGVIIRLNTGNGTYTTHTLNLPTMDSSKIRVGDFNGDAKLDLLIADNGFLTPGQLIVLLGNGDGTFSISQIIATDQASLELGDFNGDGKVDILYGRFSIDRFIVLAGAGDGTFSPASDFPASDLGREFIKVGDFNGDGHADLVTNTRTGGLAILLGRGDATFDAPVFFLSSGSISNLAAGDFNADGNLDVATSNLGSFTSVSVFLGNGNGTFAAPNVYPVPSMSPQQLVVADFNGDGRADIALGGQGFNSTNPNLFLFLGNGDGTLGLSSSYVVDVLSISNVLAVGDFNGDGRVDLTAAGIKITTLLGLAIPDKVAIFRPSLYMAVAQDVNGNIAWDDGIDTATFFGATGDTMIYGDWDGSGTTKVGIFRAAAGMFALDINGNGAYDPGIDTYGFFGQPGDVPIIGDWNGDGKSKIGIYRPATALFALDYNGNLAFDGTDKFGKYGLVGDTPLVGDWTGDGKSKVGVFRNGLWSLDNNNNLTSDAGDATSTMGQAGDVPLLGDWNGDGRTKVAIYRSTAGLFIEDYNGNLVLDGGDRSGVFGSPGSTPVVGDWTGSGIDRIGVFFGNGYWGLDINGNLTWDAGVKFGGFGDATLDTPVVGKWQ